MSVAIDLDDPYYNCGIYIVHTLTGYDTHTSSQKRATETAELFMSVSTKQSSLTTQP